MAGKSCVSGGFFYNFIHHKSIHASCFKHKLSIKVKNNGADFSYFNVWSRVVCFNKYFLLENMIFTFKLYLFINVNLFKLFLHIEK